MVRPLTYFIRTFGCQMNVADSLAYAQILEDLGCVRIEDESACDILVINTCSVRGKAEEKAISYIGSIALDSLKGIVLTGCMATVRGDEIRSRFPIIKTIVPATETESFREKMIRAWPELRKNVPDSGRIPLLRPEEKFERFVPIVRGCINHCAYCIVPSARGAFIASVPPDQIFAETDALIKSGIKSMTFIGQNVCSYGIEPDRLPGWDQYDRSYGFASLLRDIREKFGDMGVWFKFLTTHPRDVTDDLIDIIASHPAFSRHFHLPFQAGDDEVLRRMGRGYTSAYYIDLISRIRSRIPDARLSTDVIVGFPGEDESAFEHTLDLLRTVRFDSAFTFLYSPRIGTPAEKWADPVPKDEKKRRLQILIALQNEITLERAKGKIGEERMMLVESSATGSKYRDSAWVAGRTRDEEVIVIPGDESDFGNFIHVRITDANLRSFAGERI